LFSFSLECRKTTYSPDRISRSFSLAAVDNMWFVSLFFSFLMILAQLCDVAYGNSAYGLVQLEGGPTNRPVLRVPKILPFHFTQISVAFVIYVSIGSTVYSSFNWFNFQF